MSKKPKSEQRLILPKSQFRLVEPTNSSGSICPQEALFGPRCPHAWGRWKCSQEMIFCNCEAANLHLPANQLPSTPPRVSGHGVR
ncbi:Hypothetical predicted protein [Prunus dulcis]|uniref:Uncharacterized protein n=1 Tax=Prunus dulcis TaxID=3755 RepID=A0A5E4F7A7_PRUDU|nr:Hypothetical predicted protein [Prunus dulcis]